MEDQQALTQEIWGHEDLDGSAAGLWRNCVRVHAASLFRGIRMCFVPAPGDVGRGGRAATRNAKACHDLQQCLKRGDTRALRQLKLHPDFLDTIDQVRRKLAMRLAGSLHVCTHAQLLDKLSQWSFDGSSRKEPIPTDTHPYLGPAVVATLEEHVEEVCKERCAEMEQTVQEIESRIPMPAYRVKEELEECYILTSAAFKDRLQFLLFLGEASVHKWQTKFEIICRERIDQASATNDRVLEGRRQTVVQQSLPEARKQLQEEDALFPPGEVRANGENNAGEVIRADFRFCLEVTARFHGVLERASEGVPVGRGTGWRSL